MYYSLRSKSNNICILCEKGICLSAGYKVEADDVVKPWTEGFNPMNDSILLIAAFQKCFCPKGSSEIFSTEHNIDENWFCSECTNLLEEWSCENLVEEKTSYIRMSQIKATLSSKILCTRGTQVDELLAKNESKFQRNFLLLVKSVRQQLGREYTVCVKVEKLNDTSDLDRRSQFHCDKESKIRHQKDPEIPHRLRCNFPGCSYRTAYPNSLTNHQRKHTDEKPFACPQTDCSFRSNWKKSITDHQRTHQKEKLKPFGCSFPTCDYRAYQPSTVKYHETKHTDTQGSITCPFPGCEYRTKWSHSLKLHSVIHEKEEEKRQPYECDYPGCKRRFSQRNNLRSHRQRVHGPSDLKPFSCQFPGCDYKGKTKQDLMRHEELHGPKKHQCPECPKRFHEKGHLRTHFRTHSEEKLFACSYPSCTFRARIKGTVRSHEKTHENLRPFACTFPGCEYRASEDRHRKQHEATHDPFRAKSHQCSLCFRGFSQRSNLVSHIKRHLNETTHFCNQCEFATFTAKELNSHLERIHRNPKKRRSRTPRIQQGIDGSHGQRKNKLFKCKYCDFSSDLTSGLGNHLAFKHPDKQVVAFS